MTPVRSMLAAVAALAVLAGCESDDGDAPPPVAAEPVGAGPYISERTTDEIAVSIRIPAAAHELPGVGERLAAEAEAVAADVARRAAERRREGPSYFRPSTLWVEWSVSYDARGAVGLLGETFMDEGGANPLESRQTVIYDRDAGREVGFADLFSDPRPLGPAMTAVSDAAFAAWAEASPQAERGLQLVDERILVDVREATRPRAASFARFVLVPDEDDPSRLAGVSLLYDEGLLGPRSDGSYALFVPAAVLAPHLKPQWSARFVAAPEAER